MGVNFITKHHEKLCLYSNRKNYYAETAADVCFYLEQEGYESNYTCDIEDEWLLTVLWTGIKMYLN